ncbi:hypothetical protein DLH97_24790 [Vibrio parahaemolyticus]|nr:hypothetical protein [Vibrio parahaemolyticus]EGR2875335.1 hypothetical protein [Vibrio parahaemolyticus]
MPIITVNLGVYGGIVDTDCYQIVANQTWFDGLQLQLKCLWCRKTVNANANNKLTDDFTSEHCERPASLAFENTKLPKMVDITVYNL